MSGDEELTVSDNEQYIDNATSAYTEANDFYQLLMENNLMKIASLSFAILAAIIGPLMISGIIWYEKYGSDKKRTLMNRLVSSACWSVLQFCYFVYIPEIFRFAFRPLPQKFCFVIGVVRNALFTNIVLCYDAIAVIRFAYIFWLKNPAAFHDDFWFCFLTKWIKGFGLIFQFVWHTHSPRQPLGFYICAGIDPTEIFKVPLKIYGVVESFSFLLNFFIFLKIKIYKRKFSRAEQTAERGCLRKGLFLGEIESQSLASFATNLSNVFLLTLSVFNVVLLNKIDPGNINQYPYTLYVFYIFFYGPAFLALVSCLIYYHRNGPMRREITNELKNQKIKFCEFIWRIWGSGIFQGSDNFEENSIRKD